MFRISVALFIAIQHIINHTNKTGEVADSIQVDLMPESRYLYLKPQGKNASIENAEEITEGEYQGYYQIDLKELRENSIDGGFDINIKFNEIEEIENVPGISTVSYQVQNIYITKAGDEEILNGTRDFTGYAGSILTLNPIYQHGTDLNQNLIIGGKRIADYKYKVIEIKNDGKVEIIGYHEDKDRGLEGYTKNTSEKIENAIIKFRFVDLNHVLYKIIYRGALDGYLDGTEYDLSLTGDGIDKFDILTTKYYVAQKNDIVNIKDLNFDSDGYSLIKTLDVEGLEEAGQGNVLKEELVTNNGVTTKRVYLAGEADYKLKDDNYEFIYSYGSTMSELEMVKVEYEVKFETMPGGYTKELEFPILKDDYTVQVPVDLRYTCFTFTPTEGIELSHTDDSVITEMSTDGASITLKIKGTGDKVYFPTINKAKSKRQMIENISDTEASGDKQLNKITITYGEEKETGATSCIYIPEPEEKEIKIYRRYKANEKDLNYKVEEYKTIKTYDFGENTIIPGIEQELMISRDYLYKKNNKIYQYLPYQEDENNTGITDIDGNHIDGISNVENTEDINHKKLTDAGEIYINYKEREKPKVPKDDKTNPFKQRYYYIPFSYFQEGMSLNGNIENSQNILNNLWKIDKNIFDSSSVFYDPDFIYPGSALGADIEESNSKYKEKLNQLEGYINEYYEEYKGEEGLDYYKVYVRENNLEDLNVTSYMSDTSNDMTIDGYINYLKETIKANTEEAETEDAVSENLVDETLQTRDTNKNKSLEKSLETAKSYKENLIKLELIRYLEIKKSVPVMVYNNRSADVFTDAHAEKRSVNWVDTANPKAANQNNVNTGKSISYEGVDSNGKTVIYTETAYRSIDYSNQPLSISSSINQDIDKFLTNKTPTDIRGMVNVDAGFEVGNNIPIIYIQRQNLTKRVTSKIKPEIPVSSNLSINYVQVKKLDNNKYEIVKKDTGEDNIFYTYRYNEIPQYLLGRELLWKIQSINGMNYISEKDAINAKDDSGTTIGIYKRSPRIEQTQNVKYQVDLYYEGNVPENLEESNIAVVGYEISKNEKLYNQNYTGLTDSSIKIFPKNFENKNTYLLDKDGNITQDYSGIDVSFPTEKGKVKQQTFYYLEKNNSDKLLRKIYVDDADSEISNSDLQIVDKTKDTIIENAKNVSGYKERIQEVKLDFNRSQIKYSIQELTQAEEVNYEIEKIGNTEILKDKNTNRKLVELTELGQNNETKIKFYYDEIVTPNPGPGPDEDNTDYQGGGSGGGVPISNPAKPKDELASLGDIHTSYMNGYEDGSVRPEGNITRSEVATIIYRIMPEDRRMLMYSNEYKFNDQSYKWSKEYISTLSNGGVIKGYPDGSFRPNDNITRAEAVAMIARYNSLSNAQNPYLDAKGHWAEGEIGALNLLGWAQGYEDSTFRPNDKITRAEFVTLINRMLDRGIEKDHIEKNLIKQFTDLNENKWYYDEMVEASSSHEYVKESELRKSELWIDVIN